MKSNNMKRYYENKQTVQILKKKIYIYFKYKQNSFNSDNNNNIIF